MDLSYIDIIFRLGLAVLLGGLVGIERETHKRPAGFRTHILVCVGSALIMMVSAYGFTGLGDNEPSRIAAQVVTGIGFLGAGTIIQQRGSIRGLTTAASIWVVAAIGLATGIGFYPGAVVTTLLAIVSLLVLGRVDRVIVSQRRERHLRIKAVDKPDLMCRVAEVLGDLELSIRKVEMSRHEYDLELKDKDNVVIMDLLLFSPLHLKAEELFCRLFSLNGILHIRWQGRDVPLKEEEASR